MNQMKQYRTMGGGRSRPTNIIAFIVAIGLSAATAALKLTGVTSCSWWIVTLPMWGGVAVVWIIIAVAIIAASMAQKKNHSKGIEALCKHLRRK
jgi:hypothetical protein